MSCPATLSIRSLDMTVTRDTVDYYVMRLFRPSDMLIEHIDSEDRDRLTEHVGEDLAEEFDADNPLTLVRFQCSAREALDRLYLFGVTRDVSEKLFYSGLRADIKRYEDYQKRSPQAFEEILLTLRFLTLDAWMQALTRILDSGLTRGALAAVDPADPEFPILRYMLEFSRDLYGFPGYNPLAAFHLILSQTRPEEQISYDLTDLVVRHCIDHNGLLSEIEYIHDEILAEHRVIVLTEGKTDSMVLERSLALFFPHLVDYFHFLDFRDAKVSGGAGELVNLVRAFAGAGVRARVLAILDNDTAAAAALSRLDAQALPDNIVVFRYPDSDIARDYPTTGPSGHQNMNVNGQAASIELYLGDDVLRDADGVLRRVQWTGYDPKIAAYQGQVQGKNEILQNFIQKIDSCERDPSRLHSSDWGAIRAILETLLSAFHPVDTAALLGIGGHK